ncbi:MAG: ATP-binding protein [Psychrobacter sp.]|nr:ATP-binding protein [Psychrobacter sp.]
MNTPKKVPTFTIRLTLFWRLFLSLILTILLTSVLSIVVERALVEKALTERMNIQIDSLLNKREEMVQALHRGDLDAVKQMYHEDRRLMNQIRVYDEQGTIIFPRYRDREDWGSNPQVDNRKALLDTPIPPLIPKLTDSQLSRDSTGATERNQIDESHDSWRSVLSRGTMVADTDIHSEMTDVSVVLPDEQTFIVQVRPNLRFADVVALQRGNFPVRLTIIIVFSILVCIWLSRTLTKRMRRMQHTVYRMIDGDYQAHTSLTKMGGDELGLLAKDVAKLSSRLAESELARKQMLSDISHELRSPLARLEVATELTRDFAPNADRYLDRIDKESARMNELIEQIIHIQSLQMQQNTIDNLEDELVDVAEIISDIGQDVCFEFQHKNVCWQWQQPESALSDTASATDWTVLGNQEQLHSALENVIRNAFMHTAADSTVIANIKQVEMENKAPAIQVSVTDVGGGVAVDDLDRIFQPFVRLDSARHRETGGYGLGLAIVHAVVMSHKGHINAYNRQDGVQGLVVQITLPTCE